MNCQNHSSSGSHYPVKKPPLFLGEPASTLASDVCYFCGNSDGKLHEVTSFRLDRRVRLSAYILTETEHSLIEKLSKGDIEQKAKYHATCLVDLYRMADRFKIGSSYIDDEKQKHSSAFASVISFISLIASILQTLKRRK